MKNTTLQLMHSANRLLPLSSITTFRDEQALRRGGVERVNWSPCLQAAFLLLVYFSFLVFLGISFPEGGVGGVAEGLGGRARVGERILLVEAHGRALVHAHVGVAQQPSGLALDALGV